MTTLTFQNTTISIIDHNNQKWIPALEVGKALGYADPSANISKLYERNKDEFTSSMTAIIDMDTASGMQKVRIFSLRGCWLLGMRSHTKVAKDFRKWVLDILDREISKKQSAVIPKLSKEHQTAIKDLVIGRAQGLPKEKQAEVIIKQWSALKTHFGKSYKEINDDQFAEAVSLIARLPLEGELITDTAQTTQNVTIPHAGRWLVVTDGYDEKRTIVKNINGKNCIDAEIHRKLINETHLMADLLLELASRMRIVNGECHPARFDTPILQSNRKTII